MAHIHQIEDIKRDYLTQKIGKVAPVSPQSARQTHACRQSSANPGDLPPGRSWVAEPVVPPGDESVASTPFVSLEHHDEATTRETLNLPDYEPREKYSFY